MAVFLSVKKLRTYVPAYAKKTQIKLRNSHPPINLSHIAPLTSCYFLPPVKNSIQYNVIFYQSSCYFSPPTINSMQNNTHIITTTIKKSPFSFSNLKKKFLKRPCVLQNEKNIIWKIKNKYNSLCDHKIIFYRSLQCKNVGCAQWATSLNSEHGFEAEGDRFCLADTIL